MTKSNRKRESKYVDQMHLSSDPATVEKARKNYKVRGYDSLSAYIRSLVWDDDNRISDPDRYGCAVSLRGSMPQSGVAE